MSSYLPPLDSLKSLKTMLQQRRETLSLAESCTGGLLSFWLTYLPGSSHYFKGSLVAYDIQAKTHILNVKKETIKQKGVVSEESAQEMAQSVRNLFSSDWGFATTGWTGPDQDDDSLPVGTVCLALCSKFAKKSRIEYFKSKERQEIQFQATLFALDFLMSALH